MSINELCPDVILTTPRLTLRRFNPGDLDFLASLLGDPEVMRFYPRTLDRSGAMAWMEKSLVRYDRDGHGFWLVCDRESGQPRGQAGVLKQELEGRQIIEVGYMLDKSYWRQGLATEAARACRDWAFRNLPVDAVHSLIRPVNLPSQGVARKNGMSPEPETVQFYGLEHFLFRITRTEWAGGEAPPGGTLADPHRHS